MNLLGYAGSAPALTDLLAGQADVMCGDLTTLQFYVQSAQIGARALTSALRSTQPPFAALPTMGERGFAGFPLTSWYGLYAPRGTPLPVLHTLQRALRAAVQDGALRSGFAELGATMVDDERLTPTSHRRFVELETARFAPLLRAAGQYAD